MKWITRWTDTRGQGFISKKPESMARTISRLRIILRKGKKTAAMISITPATPPPK